MSWFYTYESDAATSDRMHAVLHEAVFALLASGKSNAAAFCRFDPSGAGGSHFYLSPEAASLAVGHSWRPCEPPSRKEAGSLMVGHQSSIDTLFK